MNIHRKGKIPEPEAEKQIPGNVNRWMKEATGATVATPCRDLQKSNYEHRITAGTLIYTIGAGITAAAGTRLALQSFLAKIEFANQAHCDPRINPSSLFLSLPP